MTTQDLCKLTFLSARQILAAEECVPDQPGVYLFFFRGGNKLLAETSYFELGCRRPLSFHRRQHLYTGAAHDLRRRLKQHMSIIEASSMRRSLLAVERERKAISSTGTPACTVNGEQTLTEWLRRNAIIGMEVVTSPFERERQLLSRYASPLNLTLRRAEPFARSLLEMRRNAFSRRDRHEVQRRRSS